MAGRFAAVRLGADHLEDLAAPCGKFAGRLGHLRRDRSRLGMDRFGAMREASASRRSVLASLKMARAMSRIWRELTPAGRPAAAIALAMTAS
ncbi:MAG: hypothetical protein ACREC0_01145 [Methylocella sp.]